MRVIAGSLKGRRLRTPSWEGLRPTSDKLRETLFNVLAPRMHGARVLDGYAGTGALGIEALSRGAGSVTFVDYDRRAQALIAENLALCGLSEGCAIIPTKVALAIETLRHQPAFEPFDIVLLDPPYAPSGQESLESVVTAAGSVVARTGILVLEHASRARAPESCGSLVRTRTIVSGDSALSFYEVSQHDSLTVAR
jgi:16S rRNA (guanine(966)-N(2))-methyltransferase RsmD